MYSLEEYADGGDYTDELVRLESLEGELIAEYVSLSPDNTKRANEIYVELLRVRKKIANELGLESYIDRAYEMRGHDHTADEVHAMILNIGKYVLPVYFALYDELFDDYFSTAMPSNVDKAELLNNLYLLFDDTDENLAEAYSFMLECGLYDIEDYSDKRYEGAFTTYIFGIDAPYIFMTSWGDVGDYLTLTHEFGHFFDSYANFGLGSSLSLGEISSQALELMTVPRLDGIISEEDLLFLSYYQLYIALDTLLYQGFIALFEHYVYALEYEDINLTALERLLNKAQLDMFGENVGLGQLESVIMQHTVAYPFYVESYCTSLFASLDIFLTDIENEGDGLEIYLDLILGGDPNDKTFKSELERVGLDTPFTESYVISISDEIYYYLTGIHFYTNESQAA
jgi:oligoendopeptidase F